MLTQSDKDYYGQKDQTEQYGHPKIRDKIFIEIEKRIKYER